MTQSPSSRLATESVLEPSLILVGPVSLASKAWKTTAERQRSDLQRRHYDGEAAYGGYAKDVVVKEAFVLRVPENLDYAASAPLLCAGVTVYSPLKHWKVGPGMKVAIMGLGGLGHMAVKFAAAMGAETYVLGHSPSKAADAKEMGATEYLITKDSYESHKDTFDVILNTTSTDLEVDSLVGMLKVGGTLIFVGVSGNNQSFHPFSLITGLKSIAGQTREASPAPKRCLISVVSTTLFQPLRWLMPATQKPLMMPMPRVVDSDIRYRFVIDASTI